VNDDLISWLQNWYTAQCHGNWEHHYGITIGTLDNPGWYVVINLVETPLETATFEPVERHRSQEDWVEWRDLARREARPLPPSKVHGFQRAKEDRGAANI
jgi:Immunity protein 53